MRWKILDFAIDLLCDGLKIEEYWKMFMQTQKVKEGQVYRHYKGGLYKVIKIAYSTEGKLIEKASDIDDSVKLVVYRSLDLHSALGNDVWWVRPYLLFIEPVIIDGEEQPRFTEAQEGKDECFLCIENPEMAAWVKRATPAPKKRRQKEAIPF